METRASYIMVGGFVLVFLSGLIAFAIWIAKVDLDAEYTDYDIFFDSTVAGLYKRSVVYYSGIPVGDVRDITLAPDNPQKVRVYVRLNAEVPVTEGAVARLEFQGLTGVAYIELSGGPVGGKKLVPAKGKERAVIPSEMSPLLEVYESAPNLVNEAIKAVAQVQKLLSDDKLAHVTSILQNADRLSANLADSSENIDELLADIQVLVKKTGETADKLNRLATNGNELLENDGQQLFAEAIATLQASQDMINRVDNLVAANSDNITQFVGNSLPELTRMIVDLRATARSLARVVTQAEKDPTRVLFGGNEAKYDIKTRALQEEKE